MPSDSMNQETIVMLVSMIYLNHLPALFQMMKGP